MDASGLRFADSASIRALMLAARTLMERGGRLALLQPQRPLAKMLGLLGVDEMVTIVEETPDGSAADGNAG